MTSGLDVLRNNFTLSIVNSGLDILRKNGWNFEKAVKDVYFNIEIIDSNTLIDGNKKPTFCDEDNKVIEILKSYAYDKKYLWFTDNMGWSAYEFFNAYCYSKKGWTRNQMDFYKFFTENYKNKIYPANFESFIPFSGQFAVMLIKNTDGNIPKIIVDNRVDLIFDTYLKIAKSANLNN